MTRVLRAERRGPAYVPHAAISAAERDGYEHGLTRACAELAAAWIDVAAARDQLLGELEPQTLEVAFAAARQLLGDSLELHPELVAQLTERLLTRVRRARSIVVHVHPLDAAALEAWLARPGERPTTASLRIETDPALTRGGCVVRSDVGTLDARVETRIDALRSALERMRQAP